MNLFALNEIIAFKKMTGDVDNHVNPSMTEICRHCVGVDKSLFEFRDITDLWLEYHPEKKELGSVEKTFL